MAIRAPDGANNDDWLIEKSEQQYQKQQLQGKTCAMQVLPMHENTDVETMMDSPSSTPFLPFQLGTGYFILF